MSAPSSPQPDWVAAASGALARRPQLWGELLRRHVPDPGGRCCGCTRAGTGIPAAAWPCTLHELAARAQRLHERGLAGTSAAGPMTAADVARDPAVVDIGRRFTDSGDAGPSGSLAG